MAYRTLKETVAQAFVEQFKAFAAGQEEKPNDTAVQCEAYIVGDCPNAVNFNNTPGGAVSGSHADQEEIKPIVTSCAFCPLAAADNTQFQNDLAAAGMVVDSVARIDEQSHGTKQKEYRCNAVGKTFNVIFFHSPQRPGDYSNHPPQGYVELGIK